jgi:hypothetical protein
MPLVFVGTGFVLDLGLGITAAHIISGLLRTGISRDQIGLLFVMDSGARHIPVMLGTLQPGFQIKRTTRAGEFPLIDHTQNVDPFEDVAILRLPGQGGELRGRGLRVGDIRNAHVGDPVFLAGYIRGNRLLNLPGSESKRIGPTFLAGHIAAINPIGVSWHPMAVDFLINATSARALSGAPVCNDRGEVIGILTGGIELDLPVVPAEARRQNQKDPPTHDHEYDVSVPMNIARVLPLYPKIFEAAREGPDSAPPAAS